MKIFIIIGSFHALYLSFLVIKKKGKAISDYILAILLFLLFSMFGIVYYSIEWNLPILQLLIWNISLLIAPILFLYAITLMDEQYKLKKKWILYFIPYILSVLHLIITIIYTKESEMENVFNIDKMFNEVSILNFFMWLDLISIPFYFFLISRTIKQFKIKLLFNFSNLKNRNLNWLNHLIIGMFFIWLLIYSFILLGFSTDENSILFGFSLSSIFIYYIGFFGLNQKAIFIKTSKNETEEKYKKSSIKKSELDIYATKIKQFMESDKPYLNNDLNLYHFSKLLGISTHDLSQLLNQKFNQNFYTFINSYRINEFKKRVQEDDLKKFTILSIAYDCGFNSKSSFNRIFKNNTGQTPLSFIKSIIPNQHQNKP